MKTRLVAATLLSAAIAAVPLAAAPAPAGDDTEITVHYAYGSTKSFTLEGRVAERTVAHEARATDSRLGNLWRSLRSLRVEEQKGFPLRIAVGSGNWTTRSDEEGYFALRAQTPPGVSPGWNTVRVEGADGAAAAEEPLLIVPDGEVTGIITDFDDTLVVSEVPDRARLLGHTLLENSLQRQPVPGMAAFLRRQLARNALPEAAPVIYLTGSPRQLEPGIRAFLEHNGFPRGPILAKKISGGGDPLLDQEGYKLARVEQILQDFPAVRFVLVGDDGERDPEVYRAIRARHPKRVAAVYIRWVSQDPGRPSYPEQPPPPVEATGPDPR